jgi:hypothetical protein
MISGEKRGGNSRERLLLAFSALALEFESRGAKCFRNVFVHGELLEVDGVDHGEQVERDVEGKFGVVDEIADDRVVLAEDAVGGDETQNFVGEIGHGSERFDLLISEARRLQHGALNDFVGVANECAARFGAAFDGELNALGDGHFGDLLEKRLAALDVGLGFGSGFGKMGFVGCAAVHFVKNIFLVGGDGRGVLESGGESEGVTDTAQIVEQRLNADSGKVLDDGNQQAGGAILILNERFADTGLIGKILRGIREQRRKSFGTFDCADESIGRNREKSFLRASGNHLIGIISKDSENFHAIDRIHVGSRGAHGKFALAGRAVVAKVVYNFRAEMLHR